jgi:hypothetical protein
VDFVAFLEWLDRERPATLPASVVAKVEPQPWFERRGPGNEARIWINVAKRHRYERNQTEALWTRVEGVTSDFDVLDERAA